MNKRDIEEAIKNLSVIEAKPESPTPTPIKIDLSKLSIVEKRHMEDFVAKGFPDLHLYDKERMLEAYLAGADTQELLHMFPNTQAGGIAYLKLSEDWASLRREYVEDLQYKSKIKLMETKSQAVSSITMLVNLFHREIQPKILLYMQTGDPAHLPKRFGIKSFHDYQKFIELLSKISKLSPGEVLSLEPPSHNINIKTDNLSIGNDNRKIETTITKSKEDVQSAAHKLLADFYGKK